MNAKTEGGRVMELISELAPDAQRRVFITAQILRDLLQADPTQESALAFTLVLAEVSES